MILKLVALVFSALSLYELFTDISIIISSGTDLG